MKRIRYGRQDKGNKNDSSYAITNLNKVSHKVKKHESANPNFEVLKQSHPNPVAEYKNT